MGLLDDAIREHLELKRRSGADPGAIAREEREALAPVLDDADVDGGEELVEDDVVREELEVELTTTPISAAPVEEQVVQSDPLAAVSSLGQETAEIDMQAILDEDPDAAEGGSPVGPIADGPTPAPYTGEAPGVVDGVDWDVPHEPEAGAASFDLPGQARLTFE